MIGTYCTKCRALLKVTEPDQCAALFSSVGVGACAVPGCDGAVVPLFDEQAFQNLSPAGRFLGTVKGHVYQRFLLGLGPYSELDITQELIASLFTHSIVGIDGELKPSGYIVRALVFDDGTRAVLGPDFTNGAAVIYRVSPPAEVGDGGNASNAGAPGDQPGAP